MIDKKTLEEIYGGIETDLTKRWEEGTAHHPKSVSLLSHITALDFHFQNDYFNWHSGGDGDNGESLMYLLDLYFERLDRNEKRLK